VDAASDQFLAAAGLAGNQDSLSVASHALDHGHKALHRATGYDELGAMNFALNRRSCFQCVPRRLPEHTSSVPFRAEPKKKLAQEEENS